MEQIKPQGQNQLDDQEHQDLHELQERLRQPMLRSFVITVEFNLQYQRENLAMEAIIDALRAGSMRVKHIQPLHKTPDE